jgi:hypothetical protein
LFVVRGARDALGSEAERQHHSLGITYSRGAKATIESHAQPP